MAARCPKGRACCPIKRASFVVQRYQLIVEYDGGAYVGWQRQDNGSSVQAALEDAAFAFAQERVHIQGAGRTDAGVHARAMTAHLDLAKPTNANRVREALNALLRGHKISVLKVQDAPDSFNARFSCLGRSYEYRILNRRPEPTFDRPYCWHHRGPLDHEAMQAAARLLEGRHDFSAFRAAECQAASPVKTLDHLSVERQQDWIIIRSYAKSYIHNQVRNMVGSLAQVGRGKWAPEDLKAVLDGRDRQAAGPCAPASGLFFWRAWYSEAESPAQNPAFFDHPLAPGHVSFGSPAEAGAL